MTLPVAILAGGKATRLYPLTEAVPKSLIEVAGKPFFHHQLEQLCRNHVQRVFLCVGYLGDQIQQAVGDGSRFKLRIDYVCDGPRLLGTGGALKKAAAAIGEAFLVLYGDSYLEIDYPPVEQAFLRSSNRGLMTVFKNAGQWDRSNVLFSNGRIVSYKKKNPTPDMQYIDYGLGALRKTAFDNFSDCDSFDLVDVYQQLIQQNQLAGFEARRDFFPI